MTLDPSSLLVSEVFGPTWQGEGPSLGRRTGFLRLGQCNLDCAWCDTPYTWDWSRYDKETELSRRSIADLVAEIAALDVPMLVISGGEPLMQQQGVAELLAALPSTLRVEIETNGTIAPHADIIDRVDQFNVSPKLANSLVLLGKRRKSSVLRALRESGKAVFKFVAASVADLAEIDEIVTAAELAPIYVMAEGTSPDVILTRTRELADTVLARGWNMTTRLHVLIWGEQRGV